MMKFGIKSILFVIFLIGNSFSTKAQLYDVFTNTLYDDKSTYVFEEESDLDYLPRKLKISQDHIRNDDFSEEIFVEIREMAKQTLENQLVFQSIYQEVLQQVKRYNTLVSETRRNQELSHPEFHDLSIEIVSVLNQQAIFQLKYGFTTSEGYYGGSYEFKVAHYYHLDLTTNKIKRFTPYIHAYTQTIPAIIKEKIKRIYGISTEKIDLNQLDTSIVSPSFESFINSLSLRELKVIPYFSGALVEFDAYSTSSFWLQGGEFQLFLDYYEVQELKSILPYFSQFYPPSKDIQPLHSQFEKYKNKTADFTKEPFAIDFILNQENNTLASASIQFTNISNENSTQLEEYSFTSTGKIQTYKKWVNDSVLNKNVVYNYNEHDQLQSKFTFNREENIEEIELYSYRNGVLTSVEKIYQDDVPKWLTSLKSKVFEINVETQYYFANGEYQYILDFSFLKNNGNARMSAEYLSGNKFCSDFSCFLFDDKKRVIGREGKKYSSYGAQLLTNEEGQLLEYFYDNDRNKWYYSYDAENRLTSLKKYGDGKLNTDYSYQYENNSKVPTLIRYKGSRGNWKYKIEIQ